MFQAVLTTVVFSTVLVFAAPVPPPGIEDLFIRGEANLDGDYNLADATAILSYLAGQPDHGIQHYDAADLNDDGFLTLEDEIWILRDLYGQGPDPMPPFPDLGVDPTLDTITRNRVEPPVEPKPDPGYKVWLYWVTPPDAGSGDIRMRIVAFSDTDIIGVAPSMGEVHAAVKYDPQALRFEDARCIAGDPWRVTAVHFTDSVVDPSPGDGDIVLPVIRDRGEVGLSFFHEVLLQGPHPVPLGRDLVELRFSRQADVATARPMLTFTVGTNNLYYTTGAGVWKPLVSPDDPVAPPASISPRFVVSLRETGSRFVRGDANADASFDISDPIMLLMYLFGGGPAPTCLDAADVNDSGVTDISDAMYFLAWMFLGGPQPPAPFGSIPDGCGVDPTHDLQSCERYDPCYGPSVVEPPVLGQ